MRPSLPPNYETTTAKVRAILKGFRGHASNRLPEVRRWTRRTKLAVLAAVLALLLLVGGAGYSLVGGTLHSPRADLATHVVHCGPLPLTIVERGTLESATNNDIVCHVKAGTKGTTIASQIKWVIEEGAQVKQGDVLMTLDDSGLQEQLKAQKIVVDNAEAAAIQADENLKIVQSQNESDTQTAKTAIELAELDLTKYLEGEYLQTKKDILGRMKTADSDLQMQQDRTAWAKRMVTKNYMTPTQAQAEQSRLLAVDIALQKVQEELRVLEDYTKKRTVKDLRTKLDEAKRALRRTEKQARAKEVQAATDQKAKRSIHLQEQAHYEEIEEVIRKCTIVAPQDGLIVYYIPDQARWGGGSQQSIIAQGEPVREGQKLIRIPDLQHMVVNTRIHEALVSRVHGERFTPTGFGERLRAAMLTSPDLFTRLFAEHAFCDIREKFHDNEQRLISNGQPAAIRIDAMPDRSLRGHVKTVATVSSQQDLLSADVKVYQTMVAIDDVVDGLKPGMSAEVTIQIEDQLDHVLTVPLQAVIGSVELGKERKCFVVNAAGRPEERSIVVGLSNDQMAEVKSGLEEGEEVVLNPKALLDDNAAPK
jgi:multidrug efflux pump subunit AcrA (membrane-fusion protein)